MIKHTILLVFSAYFVCSQRHGAFGEPQRGKPLHFSDIAKHFESVTSQSTSMQDLAKAVEPALAQIRKRRSEEKSPDAKDSAGKVGPAGFESADEIDPDLLQDNGSAFRSAVNTEPEERAFPPGEVTFVDKLDTVSSEAKQLLGSIMDIVQEVSARISSFSPLNVLSFLFRRRRSLDPEVHPVLSRATRGIKNTIAKVKAKLLHFFEAHVEPLLDQIRETFRALLSPREKRSSDLEAEPSDENNPETSEKSQPRSNDPVKARGRRSARPENSNGIFLGSMNKGEQGTFRTPDLESINATAQ